MLYRSFGREEGNLVCFSAGKMISVLGSSIYTFVMGLYVLKLTGSGLSFATTILLNVLAVIVFNPVAGVIADRFNKKILVIVMDCLNGIMYLLLFAISSANGLSLTMIYASAFLTSGLTTIFAIAFDTAIPHMVSSQHLLRMNALGKIIDSISAIGGPMIGGMVFAFVDVELFILINGLSFLISAVFEGFIDFNFNVVPSEDADELASGSVLEDFKFGIIYILREKNVADILGLFTAINFFISFSLTVPMPYIINQTLGLGAANYGLIESFFPVGMILGASLVKYLVDRLPYVQLLRRTTFILGMVILLSGQPWLLVAAGLQFSDAGYVVYFSVCMFAFGTVVAMIDIPIMQYLQTEIPQSLRGRVLSISMMCVKIIAPVALVLSGMLLDSINPYVLPVSGGLVLCCVILLLSSREGKSPTESEKNVWVSENQGTTE